MEELNEVNQLLSEYQYISGYNITYNENDWDAELVLRNFPDSSDNLLVINLYGVRDFKIAPPNIGTASALCISDIRDRQLEGMRYFIEDREENMVSCCFRDYEIVYKPTDEDR